jgi:hypothetical protein
MARIRTIKPDFFTSDDICALSPLARLLYIGLWCEADREGRLVWAPRVLKRRYLPEDNCDIEALCRELIERELVVRLSRRPGQKEQRYAHTLGGEPPVEAPASSLEERVARLEEQMAEVLAQISSSATPSASSAAVSDG